MSHSACLHIGKPFEWQLAAPTCTIRNSPSMSPSCRKASCFHRRSPAAARLSGRRPPAWPVPAARLQTRMRGLLLLLLREFLEFHGRPSSRCWLHFKRRPRKGGGRVSKSLRNRQDGSRRPRVKSMLTENTTGEGRYELRRSEELRATGEGQGLQDPGRALCARPGRGRRSQRRRAEIHLRRRQLELGRRLRRLRMPTTRRRRAVG